MDSKPTRIQELETLGVLALVALAIGLLTGRQPFFWLAVILLSVALFAKPAAGVLARWWLLLASLISAVNTRVLLTVVYLLVLTPLALLYRMFHRNPLAIRGRTMTSMYVERNHAYISADLEKLW